MNLFKLTMHSRFLKMATDGDKTTLNIMNLHSYTMYTKNCVIMRSVHNPNAYFTPPTRTKQNCLVLFVRICGVN